MHRMTNWKYYREVISSVIAPLVLFLVLFCDTVEVGSILNRVHPDFVHFDFQALFTEQEQRLMKIYPGPLSRFVSQLQFELSREIFRFAKHLTKRFIGNTQDKTD